MRFDEEGNGSRAFASRLNPFTRLLTPCLPVRLGNVPVERIGHVSDVIRLFPASEEVHGDARRLERRQYGLRDRRHLVELEQGRVHVHERHLKHIRAS